jgi:UDP-N-acetylglucosamine--N-acetylmuramyl-(pentapeptide) pyrophosphoryl-undecaprenol N-acetylglucosamine transferase
MASGRQRAQRSGGRGQAAEKASRVLYVASSGGHLDELVRLADRFTPAGEGAEWVTFEGEQSDELLTGHTAHLVPPIEPKDLKAAMAALPAAYKLLARGRFDRVVSSGAAVAVPFALAAKLRRVRFHYVESAARSRGPSLTGRIIAKLPGCRLYTQYPAWADRRWQYRGSVFDGFAPGASAPAPDGRLRRVVVTFGTQKGFPFTRAAEALAKVLPQVTASGAEILWQTGWTDVSHLGIDGVRMVPPATLRAAIAEADLVIAHAGIGSALLALEYGRCPLLLPRRLAHGEHTDDHQRLISDDLDRRSLAVARDADALTAEDLLLAASMRAIPVVAPDAFALQPD